MAFIKKKQKPGACRPWSGPDSVRPNDELKGYEHHKTDSQEKIDRCLNCKLPAKFCKGNGECYVTLMEYEKLENFEPPRVKGKFDLETWERAIEAQLNTNQIAYVFGVMPRTVRDWKKRHGFKKEDENG